MSLVEHLIGVGVVSRDAVSRAAEQTAYKGRALLNHLVASGELSAQDFMTHQSGYYRVPLANLAEIDPDAAALRMVPYAMSLRLKIFPLGIFEEVLRVAVADPTDVLGLDELRAWTGRRVERRLADPAAITAAICRHYRTDEDLRQAVEGLGAHRSETGPLGGDLNPALAQFVSDHFDSPVAKTVQSILENAAQSRASDIHLEPRESGVELRYRIDGALTTVEKLPSCHHAALVARIKVISQMDIAEQRRPQDGRTSFICRGNKIDLRVSTLPTLFGEKVVMRLLNQSSVGIGSIQSLGMSPQQLNDYTHAITSKQGMILITGPTGSGKTTTLYSTLSHIRSQTSNITTIEDPVEYRLEGINQTQINPKIGVTFAGMLRTILRQDPDVILVGEIRDRETADIAFRGSLTGHLVLSTLHANSAPAAMTRLFDLGLEPYLVGSALLCVVAQRLVRVICPECREFYRPDDAVLEPFLRYFPEDVPKIFYRGRGCPKCSQTGFDGRRAIFEVLPVSDELRTAVSMRADECALTRMARRSGFKSLADAALEKALQGVTTLEEALPFLPAYGGEEESPLKALSRYVDQHRLDQLLVVKNQELAAKILRLAAPEDYVLIGPATPGLSPNEEDCQKVLNGLPAPSADENGGEWDGGPSVGHPEQPAASSERRRDARLSRDFVLQYRSPKRFGSIWQTAIVKSLSRGGCSFRVEQPIPAGNEVDLRFQFPASGHTALRGVVRYCAQPIGGVEPPVIGVEFDPAQPQEREKVGQVVQFFLHKKVRSD